MRVQLEKSGVLGVGQVFTAAHTYAELIYMSTPLDDLGG